ARKIVQDLPISPGKVLQVLGSELQGVALQLANLCPPTLCGHQKESPTSKVEGLVVYGNRARAPVRRRASAMDMPAIGAAVVALKDKSFCPCGNARSKTAAAAGRIGPHSDDRSAVTPEAAVDGCMIDAGYRSFPSISS